MRKLYRFYLEDIAEGLFIADENEIRKAIGNPLPLHHIYSVNEAYLTLEEDMIIDLGLSEDEISHVSERLGFTWSGVNPLDYVQYRCSECNEFGFIGEEMAYMNSPFKIHICKECSDK